MPVHEIKYRAVEGELSPGPFRILSVTKFTLLAVMNKWVATTLMAGSGQLLVYGTIFLIMGNPLVRQALQVTQVIDLPIPVILRNFILIQLFICIIMANIAGPRMISPELAHRALPVIYSRPIGRLGYVAGKFLALQVLVGAVSWVQVFLLFLVMWSVLPPEHLFHTTLWTQSIPLMARAMLIAVLASLVVSLFGLACSAATKNFRYAVVIFIAVMFGASFVSRVAQEVISSNMPDIGLFQVFMTLTDQLVHRVRGVVDRPVTGALLSLGVWCAASLGYLLWRLRPVDVYGE